MIKFERTGNIKKDLNIGIKENSLKVEEIKALYNTISGEVKWCLIHNDLFIHYLKQWEESDKWDHYPGHVKIFVKEKDLNSPDGEYLTAINPMHIQGEWVFLNNSFYKIPIFKMNE